MQKVEYDIGAEILMPTCILHNFSNLGPFWTICWSAYSIFCVLSHGLCPRVVGTQFLWSFSKILLATSPTSLYFRNFEIPENNKNISIFKNANPTVSNVSRIILSVFWTLYEQIPKFYFSKAPLIYFQRFKMSTFGDFQFLLFPNFHTFST